MTTNEVGRFKRRLVRLVIATVAAGLIVASLPIGAAADPPPYVKLRSMPQTGPLYADDVNRILYQMEYANPALVHIYSLDTLKERKTLSYDVTRLNASPAFRGAGLHMQGTLAAVDFAHGRLYYPRRDVSGSLVMTVIEGRAGRSRTYNLSAPAPLPSSAPTQSVTVEGISYDAKTDSLYLLYMIPLAGSGTTHSSSGRVIVAELNPSDGAARWTKTIDGCNTLPSETHTMPPFGRGKDALYVVCSSGYSLSQVGFGVLGGDATLVYKISVVDDTPGAPLVYLSPGNAIAGLFDPYSERIVLMRPTVLAVFDGIHGAWVGLVPTDARPLFGDSPRIGRVYLCELSGTDPVSKQPSGGLSVTDAEIAVQPPTATEYPAAGCTNDSASWRIVGDSKTSRVFLPQSDGTWSVMKENVPAYKAPPQLDPDAGAVDIPEDPAATDSTLSAQAAAYGMRVVMVGGPLGVLDNTASTAAQVIRQNSYQFGFTIGESSRELRFASVPLAKLSQDGLEASAISADRDDRFEGDLQTVRNYQLSGGNPSGREFPSPQPTPQAFSCTKDECTIKNTSDSPKWPYSPSSCVAFGGSTDKPESDPSVTGSKATCDFKKLTLNANADAPKQSVLGLVTVGEAGATVNVRRDKARGAIAHAESYAKNINIAGQVFIASALATVDSYATGHKGRASAADYHREFRGVSVLGPDKKTEIFKCSSPAECDPAKVLSAINGVLGPRIQARMPNPDGELLHGTKKGTASSLRQDFWQQLEERVLYDKPSEDLTMAAFELQINGNARASSGLLVQLAGVTASSLYQIFRKPEPIIVPTLPLPSLIAPTITKTIPGEPGKPQKPTIVSKLVTDRFRSGTKIFFSFVGNPFLVFGAWVLLLAPGYVAVRRVFLMRGTGSQ